MSSLLAAVDAANITINGNIVTYDRRSLIINGQRKLLISASIHYPRSVPAVSPTITILFYYHSISAEIYALFLLH